MKLSIIIPVYNLEDYVEKCLESCLAQNFSDPYKTKNKIMQGKTCKERITLFMYNRFRREWFFKFCFKMKTLFRGKR